METNLDRERRVEELFKQTLDLPSDQREPFLGQHCADDADVLARVRSLLEHYRRAADGFLAAAESPPQQSAATEFATSAQRVGPFTLVGKIGEGGMGIVYEASEPRLQRRVALKLVRPGLMSAAMLRRFEYEASLLARLDHPGIARIYHADIFDAGHGPQPYFAMELVEGRRLDEYLKEHRNRLKTRQLVELLHQICEAVQHAHAKGVVHRDLKPSNILITRDGKPKILDFGVARATDCDIQTTTMHTEPGELVGTLPYMSPEQAAGKVTELDTASDVYALGVIAYELFAGKLPYAVENKPLHEVVRAICEDEPSRLSSIDKSLRGDVETIVQKALEKDKTRRYATAGELAADVKRYLDYEPIMARPPGTWYQLTKFARRNKTFVGGVVAVMLTLLVGAGVSVYFAITANRQRAVAQRQTAEAEQRRAEADAVVKFVTDDVLAGVSPSRIPDPALRNTIVQVMLNPAADAVTQRFADAPLVEAAVRNLLALAYQSVGHPELGLPHARHAMETRRRLVGDDHPDTLWSISTTGFLMWSHNQFDEAEIMFREAIQRYRRVLGDDHPHTIGAVHNLGLVLQEQGKLREADTVVREALQLRRRVMGPDHPDTLSTIISLGHLLTQQGKYVEAEPLFREGLDRCRRVQGNDHPGTLPAIMNLAWVLRALERFDEAEPLYREAVDRYRRVMGEDHRDTVTCIDNLGLFMQERGNLAEAEQLYRDALTRRRRLLGEDDRQTLSSKAKLAGVLQELGRLEEAEPLLRDALASARRRLGDDDAYTLAFLNSMGYLLRSQGRLEEASAIFLEAVERRRRVLGDDHPDTLVSINNAASVLQARDKHADAEPLFAELYERAQAAQIPPSLAAKLMARHGLCLAKLRRYSQAEPRLREAQSRLRAANQHTSAEMRDVIAALADLCDHADRPEEAFTWRSELAALEAATRPATQPATRPAS